MPEPLSREDLEALRRWPTPAISNAIESFKIRPFNEGYMSPDIKCIFPDMGCMIGYAVTAVITADSPEGRRVTPQEWWDVVQKVPPPRVVVIHDIDSPVRGSFWGAVQANIHKALGCVGVVTDGSVRDLDEVKATGFHLFSSCVTVSHAYVHLVDVGAPVKVGGVVVKPGDLLQGDKHGVISIPLEIAREIPKAAQRIEDWERVIINYCKSKEFTVEGLKELYRKTPRPY